MKHLELRVLIVPRLKLGELNFLKRDPASLSGLFEQVGALKDTN